MKHKKVLERERINRALECILESPLTVVEAPMGFGKTTAVRAFLAGTDCRVLWISLLPGEDAPSFFWNRFAAQIGKLNKRTGDGLKRLGFPADAPQAAKILDMLKALDFARHTVLAIDDFHEAKGPQVGALLGRLAEDLPEDLRIVVMTRDASNLDVDGLLAKGRCHVVSQRTLRFSGEEVRAYCALLGLSPSREDLDRITVLAEGWISLVYLMLLGMGQGMPLGRGGAIDEWVEKVLFTPWDEAVKRFLLRVSVLDSFTAEQASFVTGEPQAEEFLRRLRRENAFVTLEEPGGEYRIHNVLLDFLRARQRDEAQRAALYRRAGEWYLAGRCFVRAYAYFWRAGDAWRVLALLEEPDNITECFAEFQGSFELFAKTPRPLLFSYPIAYLQYIGLLLTGGDPVAAAEGAARLDELQRVYEKMEGLAPERRNRVLAEISAIRIFAAFNDPRRMVKCVNEALRLLGGGSSWLMKRKNEATFGSPHFLYSYYRQRGRLRETMEYILREFPVFPRLADGCSLGCGEAAQAEYALETGDQKGAKASAHKAIYKAKTRGQASIALCANMTLIRLYLSQGKAGEALEQFNRLAHSVARENNAIYNTTLELIRGYAAACLRQPHLIPSWLQTGDMSPAHFMYQGLGFNYIVHGKALLALKEYIRLEALTEEPRQYFAALGNQLGFLHHRILGAAAKYRLYGMEAGCAQLRRALEEGREDHLLLPFAECAPDILDMVRRIALEAPEDAYVREVLFSCGQYLESLERAAFLPAAEAGALSVEEMRRGKDWKEPFPAEETALPRGRNGGLPQGPQEARSPFPKAVYVQTIPTFDIYVDGKLLPMSSPKLRELLALLVDRNGGSLSSRQAVSFLWEDRSDDQRTLALYRMTFKRLRETLEQAGIGFILGKEGCVGFIRPEALESDYFSFLRGDEEAMAKYNGEYLSEYSWAEGTNARLTGLQAMRRAKGGTQAPPGP
ncbi:MAG: LuxR family transcriptional regulator [Candidatus Limiplasma sp.]|nr:LuxR family transcriptional regulator [Candidatus Limiplasma sp.]